jgi:hypothetical protein
VSESDCGFRGECCHNGVLKVTLLKLVVARRTSVTHVAQSQPGEDYNGYCCRIVAALRFIEGIGIADDDYWCTDPKL